MKSYVTIGEGFENSSVSLMRVGGGVKNCQNYPNVINEWPLTQFSHGDNLDKLLLYKLLEPLYGRHT